MPRIPLTAQLGLHALAALWLGMMAGFFWAYSANVNQALLNMDGGMYAVVQSALNRNVRHGLFFSFFFGPPLWCALALLAAWPSRRQGWWWWLAMAGIAYLMGIVLFTHQVNLPLNRITEAWNPQALPEDWAHVRDRWNSANLWRTSVSAAAFIMAVLTLAQRAAVVVPMQDAVEKWPNQSQP
jgi:uncharacterized membrane protein